MRCEVGGHDALLVETTSGVAHCPVHPYTPNPDRDPPTKGRCAFNHYGSVWYIAKYDRWYCAVHLRKVVFFGDWKTGTPPDAA